MGQEPSPSTVLGLALRGWQRGGGASLLLERDDGLASELTLDAWLDWSLPINQLDEALVSAVGGGTLLDVGCGTGRHVRRLRAAGVDAFGIDECEAAIAIARARGLTTCTVGDIWSDNSNMSFRYDSIALFGQTIGIAGQLERLPEFLRRLASMLNDGGQILLTSNDISIANRGDYPDRQRSRGLFPGDTRLRLHWSRYVSKWFGWLYVDPEVLGSVAHQVGLDCSVIDRIHDGSMYAARLHLD